MSPKSGFVKVGNEQLHYIRLGHGSKLLIAFHGYGNDAWIFTPFEKHIGNEYNMLCIDLPHHGKSKWPDNRPLQKKDVVTIVNNLMHEFGADKVTLLGYSLGGRVCLSIIEQMPEVIEQVLLIAPDGLAFNPLYYFVTKTFVGRRLFKGLLTTPERYMKFIDWLKKKQWLDASRHKFVTYYLDSKASRSFLLKVWPGMSGIVPNIRRLKAAIRQYNIPLCIFMGNYDKIIPPKLAQHFSKDLSSVKLYVLEKGHRVFDNETLPHMAACLLS